MKKHISNNLSNKLPRYTPNDRVWNNIENELDSVNKSLNEIGNKLPQYKAPERIWNKIEVQLQRNNKKKIYFNYVKVAAVILLLIGTTTLFRFYKLKNLTNYKIFYETAIIPDSSKETNMDFNFIKTDNSQLLAEQCKSNPIICNDKNYLELHELYQNLILEEERLKKEY